MHPYPCFIGGEPRLTAATIRNVNPSDLTDVVGEYCAASLADTHDAIAAAHGAFAAWRKTNALKRSEILDRIGGEILARAGELGDLLAREEGKTLKEATAEAARSGNLFKFFAAECYRANVEGYPSVRDGIELSVRREPLGVVGIISPWNFPAAIPAWKIAPALAYGNTVVFKPAELVPGSAWALSDIIMRSGVPPGVFNLVMGEGHDVGDAIVRSPLVAGVSFTGSTKVGMAIGATLFARGARMQLEMGGKNPLIVLDDAPLDLAVDCAVQGAFFSTGQRCTASSRLIVSSGIHDAFVARLLERLKSLRVDDARAPDTDIGPVASQAQLAINERYLAIGVNQGARLAFGGQRLERARPGHYLSPALFVDTDNKMTINQDEIFGPIAAVIRVNGYDEALEVANDSSQGLSAGLVTSNPSTIRHFVDHAQAGMVQINLPTAGMDFHAPFTGQKHSAYGPAEKGSYAREFFTALKVAHQRERAT
jgi:acyl-CoA reductase-like NAD-dependent aldehyde dehydrogenase